jgi:hypothetical protein
VVELLIQGRLRQLHRIRIVSVTCKAGGCRLTKVIVAVLSPPFWERQKGLALAS